MIPATCTIMDCAAEVGAESRPTRPFPASEYKARLKKFAARLRRDRLEAALIHAEANRLYFTGFRSSSGLLTVGARSGPSFRTDFRYFEMARRELSFLSVSRAGRKAGETEALKAAARKGAWRRLGYEGAIPARVFEELRGALPEVEEWVDIEDAVRELRAVKSPAELEVIRRAVKANDEVMRRVLAELRPGMTEWDIRRLVRRWADRLAQGEAFDCIVCVGSNASRCHHHPSERRLTPNCELLLDIGSTVNGYVSDLTRTIFLGEPSGETAKIFETVLEANRKAIRAIRPGRKCGAIDAVARRHIEKAGYGPRFGHVLGHSLGLEVHEPPSFSPGSKVVLKPGMVLTVEPGIYLPGRGGVRIEDVVVVKKGGCDVLSATPRRIVLLQWARKHANEMPMPDRSIPAYMDF